METTKPIMTYSKFLKWMNANKHMFRVTRKGMIRSYNDLCPIQVWTGYTMPSAYVHKARERGMTRETVEKVMWSADGYNNNKYHGRYRRNMLKVIGRSEWKSDIRV